MLWVPALTAEREVCVCWGLPPHAIITGMKGLLQGLPLCGRQLKRACWQQRFGQQRELHRWGVTVLPEVQGCVGVCPRPDGAPGRKACLATLRLCNRGFALEERGPQGQREELLSDQPGDTYPSPIKEKQEKNFQIGSTSSKNPQKRKSSLNTY